MREVKYFVASSLDNFIARADGAVDWLLMNADYGMNDFFQSIDAVLLGRKTYEFALQQHGPKSKKKRSQGTGIKSYVFSRSIKEAADPDVTIVSENAGAFVHDLKQQSGKHIWLMGGGHLAGSLLSEGVVDEINLAVHPLLLGSGIPLVANIRRTISLSLMESKTHPNGVIQLRYRLS